MRISGGAARGIPLRVPPGDAVRPATDGLRQAGFSSLGARVAGAIFWDLFGGSGAYGLDVSEAPWRQRCAPAKRGILQKSSRRALTSATAATTAVSVRNTREPRCTSKKFFARKKSRSAADHPRSDPRASTTGESAKG